MVRYFCAMYLQIFACVYLGNSFESNDNSNCNSENEIWSPLLEDWITSKNYREARVTQLIPIQSVLEPNDTHVKTDDLEKESKISPGLKIVNDNKKTQPKQISETDMYLLSAIEKLVYKVDFMEKRLRKVEEMLYFVMAGNKIDQDPCPDHFNRAGHNCYLFSDEAIESELDWKAASKHCKKLGGVLAEMENIEENQDVVTYIQANSHLKGKDFWTGGLNPGLLWIWSNSARPVKSTTHGNKNDINSTNNTISGNGRCLRLAYNPASRSYLYRGTDCAARHYYICEKLENSAGNQLQRLSRKLFI